MSTLTELVRSGASAHVQRQHTAGRITHHLRSASPSVRLGSASTGGWETALGRDYTPRNEDERQLLDAGLPILRRQPS